MHVATQTIMIPRAGCLVLLLTLSILGNFTPVSAWFISPPTNIARANENPIDDTCLAHGERGDCEFYTCFEQRLSCGANGYMVKFGVPYCQRFQRVLPAFTQEGREFINATSRCLTTALLTAYQQDQVDCHTLSHSAFDSISSCYLANGFCDVVEDNVAPFADIYQSRHLFQTGALKIWREILEVTYHCDPERVHNFANNILHFMSRVLRVITA